ncbi:MAG: OmpA family protein [Alphaproteobacteria bacterium]|nr:OmpA family protein [Alphaproteobacteria bacterium]
METLKALFAKAEARADCDADFKRALGRKVSVAITAKVEAALKQGRKLEELEIDLIDSLHYYRHWQVLATLGDISDDRLNREEATKRYQQALDAIDDATLTKKAPSAATIKMIVGKAETARLLSQNYVAVPRTRGAPTGLGAPSIRGVVIKKVAVPITFEFGSADFTEKGTAAAQDLLSYLKAQGAPSITLAGHTDPVGSDAANHELSIRRAERVKEFLSAAEYAADIKIIGHGERQPFEPTNPEKYSVEELHQMSRRVELLR